MQTLENHRTLGGAIERAIYRTTALWVRSNHPGTEVPDAMAQHLRTIETLISQRPGGRIDITVSVLARKKHDDIAHHFRYRRTGPTCYVHEADTLPEV